MDTLITRCRFIDWMTNTHCPSVDQRPPSLKTPEANIPSLCYHHIRVYLARGQRPNDITKE